MLQLGARCGNIILGIRIAPKNKNRKGRTNVRKVEKMKRECIELFKGEIIKGEIGIFEHHTYNEILALANVSIEQAADEIIEILKHIDSIEYESDNSAMVFRYLTTKEEIMEALIFEEVENLMKDSYGYDEEDSRSHIADKIESCFEFMDKNEYVEEMIITHHETFLMDKDIEIKVYQHCAFEIGNEYYKTDPNDKNAWEETWTEIFKSEW